MFYPQHQSGHPTSSSSKHHDGPGPGPGGPGLGGPGGQGPNGPPNGLGGTWGRHPFPPPGGHGPGGLALPSPGFGGPGPNGLGGPGLGGHNAAGGGGAGGGGGGGPGGANGMMSFGPPGHHPGHGPHPSFGSGAGLHLGGGSGNTGFSYGLPGMFGGGNGQPNGVGGPGNSPPRPAESTMPMTQYWQHQLMRYEAARASNAPHHRARSAAMASRMSSKPTAVTISDPNQSSLTPVSLAPSVNGAHRKNLSVASNGPEGSRTPPPPSDGGTPSMGNVDPADPTAAPAPTTKDEESPSEPWIGLDLGGIKLRTLSPALFAFTHITQLFINHNALSSIPASISVLKQLTLLDATGNELTAIPPEIGLLFRLKELLLFDNHLTTLPYEIGTLFHLETLGIEGNPMDEKFKKLLAHEGTTALISHLRDEAPEPPPPPQREWVENSKSAAHPDEGKQETLTVLTYNILCHHFAPSTAYCYTPLWALDWNYRKGVILEELVNASADVVCLQEIDGEQFAEFFHPNLKEHGYEGCHFPRSRAKTMGRDEAKVVDGCATFWKADKLQLIETQVIEFNQVGMRRLDMRTDDMFNRVMSRDNIAVIANLEFIASGARLMVANSHIYWDHRYRDVKLVQIGMLMEELEKAAESLSALPAKLNIDPEYNHGTAPVYDPKEKGRDIPLILCADLNSTLDSAVYHFISTGEVPAGHEDFMSYGYGTYTSDGLQHRLGLESVCADFGGMRMTNFTPTFKEAIDWIFYTPKNLQVISVLGDVAQSYCDRTVGFPNVHFPSDHIPVFAQIRVKGKID